MQHRFRHSELELRGARITSKLVPEAPKGSLLCRFLCRFRICRRERVLKGVRSLRRREVERSNP
eukprot:15435589-Alexandrium_andersonii.AAC.1